LPLLHSGPSRRLAALRGLVSVIASIQTFELFVLIELLDGLVFVVQQ
jgi:hypothetical protein